MDLSDEEEEPKFYYYFTYGRHMLSRILLALAPSAKRFEIGKLGDYKLDFAGYSEKFRGSLITAVPEKDSIVWGSIWKVEAHELDAIHSAILGEGNYKSVDQCIELTDGRTLLCRMHQHLESPHVDEDELLRWKTLPSLTYMDEIRVGAKESELPEEYVEKLFHILDNGRTTSLDAFLADPTHMTAIDPVT